jgi:hypothetical protein
VDKFDDDEFFETRGTALERELDLRHPAMPDLGDQLVASELGERLFSGSGHEKPL